MENQENKESTPIKKYKNTLSQVSNKDSQELENKNSKRPIYKKLKFLSKKSPLVPSKAIPIQIDEHNLMSSSFIAFNRAKTLKNPAENRSPIRKSLITNNLPEKQLSYQNNESEKRNEFFFDESSFDDNDKDPDFNI